MTDDLMAYLESELGFTCKPPVRRGLDQAIEAFLGQHLHQRTPIQEHAIEAIYDGADALLISATASGKTEAVMIPIAARLMGDPDKSLAVYVAPTRALLNDLGRRLEAPLHRLGLDAAVRHGERSLPADKGSLRVLFTTPESLDVLLVKREDLLQRARFIIADEIHQIFGTPRGDQLAFLMQRLEAFAGAPIQRVALSATVGDPSEIAAWLRPHGEPAQVIAAEGKRRIIADFVWSTDPGTLRRVVSDGKHDKVLCFVNTRRRCDDVYLSLRDLAPYANFVHYSTLTKDQREYVERGFKQERMAVCVATTTLELGIDIGSIQEVILADAPTTVSSFLQRIGRGGRRGQHTYVTIAPQNPLEMLQFAATLHLAESGRVEPQVVGHPYSVLIQQIFSIIASKHRLCIDPDELVKLFGTFSWLDEKQILPILEHLVDQQFLRREPGRKVYEVGPELEDLIDRREIYTNISGQDAGMPVRHSGRLLAYLPLAPNQIRHGNVILFAGRFWRITGISDRGLAVELAPAVPDPVRPVWGSRGAFATSSLLAQGMRDLLVNQTELTNHQLDTDCSACLQALYDRSTDLRGCGRSVWYEPLGSKHVYYTFAGAIENQILRLLFDQLDMPCDTAKGREGIALTSKEPLDFRRLPESTDRVVSEIMTHWRRFSGWASVGPYYENLPAALRRDETVAQVATPSVVESVVRYSGMPVVPVHLGLVT